MSYSDARRLADYLRRNADGVEAVVLKTKERNARFSPGIRESRSHPGSYVVRTGPAGRVSRRKPRGMGSRDEW